MIKVCDAVKCLCGGATYPFSQRNKTAHVPDSDPVQRIFMKPRFGSASIGIQSMSADFTKVSITSLLNGVISCGNGISASLFFWSILYVGATEKQSKTVRSLQ